jgi:hypothetical protein
MSRAIVLIRIPIRRDGEGAVCAGGKIARAVGGQRRISIGATNAYMESAVPAWDAPHTRNDGGHTSPCSPYGVLSPGPRNSSSQSMTFFA